MGENKIKKQDIDAAVDTVMQGYSPKESPFIPFVRRDIKALVIKVLKGERHLDDLKNSAEGSEYEPSVRKVLQELHVLPKAQSAAQNAHVEVTDVNDQTNTHSKEAPESKNETAVKSDEKVDVSNLQVPRRKIKIPGDALVIGGLALATAAAIEVLPHLFPEKFKEKDVDVIAAPPTPPKKTNEIKFTDYIPNAYEANGQQPVAEQFEQAIPGLAHQLQTQLDWCVRDLPTDDQTRVALQNFNPTGYFHFVLDEYRYRQDVLGRILATPMPVFGTAPLHTMGGYAGHKETDSVPTDYIVLGTNNPNADKTVIHELNHALLENDKHDVGKVVVEGNTEYKARRAEAQSITKVDEADETDESHVESTITPYDKFAFRAFLMNLLDSYSIENLYQGYSVDKHQHAYKDTKGSFDKEFTDAADNAINTGIHDLSAEFIFNAFNSTDQNPTNAKMSLYLLAHILKDKILDVELVEGIYALHVLPFVEKLDKKMVAEFKGYLKAAKACRAIELSEHYQKIAEPLSDAEHEQLKKMENEQSNFKISNEVSPRKIDTINRDKKEKNLYSILSEVFIENISGFFMALIYSGLLRIYRKGRKKKLEEDAELLENIQHHARSPQFRQTMELYSHPELEEYLPQQMRATDDVFVAQVITQLGKKFKDKQLIYNKIKDIALHIGGLGTMAGALLGGKDVELQHVPLFVVAWILTALCPNLPITKIPFEALANWVYARSKAEDLIKNVRNGKLPNSIESVRVSSDESFKNHPFRSVLVDPEELEKQKEQDRIALPLYRNEIPRNCSIVGHGLYVVTVEQCLIKEIGEETYLVHTNLYGHVLVAGPDYDHCLPAKYLDRSRYALTALTLERPLPHQMGYLNMRFDKKNADGTIQESEDGEVVYVPSEYGQTLDNKYLGKYKTVTRPDDVVRSIDTWVPTFVCPPGYKISSEVYQSHGILRCEAKSTTYVRDKITLYTLLHYVGSPDEENFLHAVTHHALSSPEELRVYQERLCIGCEKELNNNRYPTKTQYYEIEYGYMRDGLVKGAQELVEDIVRVRGQRFPQKMFKRVQVAEPTPQSGSLSDLQDDLDDIGVDTLPVIAQPNAEQILTQKAEKVSCKTKLSMSASIGFVRNRRPTATLLKEAKLRFMTKNGSLASKRRSTDYMGSSEGGRQELRSYRPGDDKRHIDWNATAKSDRVVVKDVDMREKLGSEIIVNIGALIDEKYYIELFQALYEIALFNAGKTKAHQAFKTLRVLASPEMMAQGKMTISEENSMLGNKYPLERAVRLFKYPGESKEFDIVDVTLHNVGEVFDKIMDEIQVMCLKYPHIEQRVFIEDPYFLDAAAHSNLTMNEQFPSPNNKKVELVPQNPQGHLLSCASLPRADLFLSGLTRRRLLHAKLIGFAEPKV